MTEVQLNGKTNVSTWKKLAVAFITTVVTCLVLEAFYRGRLAVGASGFSANSGCRVTADPFVEYDEKHGRKFKPNGEFFATYLRDGEVVRGMVSRVTNADGLSSRTSIDEYDHSDVKILVFGDSFTCWNQQGVSWPDLCEAELERRLEMSVGLLNYAQGGYGVIQMLELASDIVRRHQPDIVIFAIIGQDLTRDRWWDKVITRDGLTRWLKSSRKDGFDDYRHAVDVMLVEERATRAWCERMLTGSAVTRADRELLRELTNRFLQLRTEVYAVRYRSSLLALDRSFLARRLVQGYPFEFRLQTIPTIRFDDFSEDVPTVRSLRVLQQSAMPMLLFYLPMGHEIVAGRPLMNRQSEKLMASLEKLSDQNIIDLASQYRRQPPAKIDLLPIDAHPNHDGLVWYAEEIANIVEESCLSRAGVNE